MLFILLDQLKCNHYAGDNALEGTGERWNIWVGLVTVDTQQSTLCVSIIINQTINAQQLGWAILKLYRFDILIFFFKNLFNAAFSYHYNSIATTLQNIHEKSCKKIEMYY